MRKLYLIIYISLTGLWTAAGTAHAQGSETYTAEPESRTTALPDTTGAPGDSILTWPYDVRARLDDLLADPIFERTQLGLYVYDLTSDSVLFEHGRRQLLRPASTEKLMTAITALAQLGGSYRLETRMFRTGELTDSVLHGDLYVVGGFDPRFGHDDLRALVAPLIRAGVKNIDGRICFDISMKDTLKWGWGWCWDDDLNVLTPLTVNGHADFSEALFRALDDAGIRHCDSVSLSMLPADAVLVGSRFHSIDQILTRMLKESDNFYAEALFYQLGKQRGEPYAAGKRSAECIRRFISELGLNPSDYVVADGSGLSLYNYLTPEVLVEALRYAYRRSNIYSHLYPALPVAGCDGTLSRRMKRGNAFGNVRAKTGTLEGVSTLAGYATAANGHVLCFAIMNQGLRYHATGRNFQDRVCEALTAP